MIEKKKEPVKPKMKRLDGNKYEVLECEGYGGLTVGSYARKPGSIFLESEWPYGEASLKAAIAKKRCKLVKPDKPDKPKEEKNDSK